MEKGKEELNAENYIDAEKLKEESRKTSIKESSSYALMDGFGLRYITPYALAIGANKFQIGLLSSLPALFANFSQVFTPKLMEKHSRKKIAVTGIFIQAILWLVLIAIGISYFYFNVQSSWFLVIFYTLLVLAGTFIGPAWSSWIKDLIYRTNNPGEFLAKRGKYAGGIALICMIIAGFLLDYFKQTKIFLGFAILFFLAFLGRLGSAYLLNKQYEPKWKKEEGYYFSLFDFVKKMNKNNYGRFVFYTALMALAINFAAPFFAVFLLEDMKFSYIQFTIIIMASAITALIVMTSWGRIADKYGNFIILKITGLILVFVPFLWIFAFFFKNPWISFIFLLLAEGFSGFAAAGYNLSAGNYIYDAVTKQRMALCVAYFSTIHGVLAFLGATIGGFLASMGISLFNTSSLLIIFFISGVLRAGALMGINKKIKEVRPIVQTFNYKRAREEFRFLNPGAFFNFLDLRIFKNRPF